MRIASGQIVRVNNPIVIYEGDRFQPRTNERGELTVDYAPAIPRKSNRIVGAWCSIILPKGGIDFKWLLEEDINRLANFSKPKNVENAQVSPLYKSNNGQIDPGFLEAKCIKHAMRAYTKLHISDSIAFEDDEQDSSQDNGFSPAETPKETVKVQQPEEDPDSPF
jgi:recombinational DNA repair protein RecT